MSAQTEVAVFGGGCFWCTEAVFERLRGVISVMPGYAGGDVKNPTYKLVCTGTTGHAEVVRVEFDPAQIPYRDLLTVFFATHDPTTLNRQGHDTGMQYRSIILYSNDAQKAAAEEMIAELNRSGTFTQPIVTEVKPLTDFYEAEEYHRRYYASNPEQPYCQFVIDPKIEKANKRFSELQRT
ncbi:MAG: peptide-methionine (S)-S-oxide reductase MsrA [Acidobacteria bacterium]|nr:peptide-methionine (S)-S-oxide reductase MsrA [Acidobacteriota bacterium]